MNADKVKQDIQYAKHRAARSEIDRWLPLILSAFIGVHRRSSAANSCSWSEVLKSVFICG